MEEQGGGRRGKRESIGRPVLAVIGFFLLIGLVFSLTNRAFFKHGRRSTPRIPSSTASPRSESGSPLAGRWRQGKDDPIVVTEDKSGKLIVETGGGSATFSPDRNGDFTEDSPDTNATAPRRTLMLAEDKEHLVIQSFQRQGSTVSNATYVRAD